jgi:hypothetical protein
VLPVQNPYSLRNSGTYKLRPLFLHFTFYIYIYLLTPRADDSINTTRRAADPLNWKNFFTNRVVEVWNMVPGMIKRSKTVSSFKNAYRSHREDMVKTPRLE